MSNRTKVGRIAALQARIDEQEAEMAKLREELAEVKRHTRPSMRRTGQCPACGAGRIIHVAKPTELAASGVAPQAIHHTTGFWGTRLYGPIEHFICRSCRLIESHAIDLEGLEPDGVQIFALDLPDGPEPEGGPYR